MYIIYFSIACFFVVSSVYGAALDVSPTPNVICKSAALNGILEVGCWGYKECVNDVLFVHNCQSDQVLLKANLTCVLKGQSQSECDNYSICGDKPDAMYADKAHNCKSYYRCYGAINVGQFYCPASLVFSDTIQSCDFPGNVEKPCGNLPETVTTILG